MPIHKYSVYAGTCLILFATSCRLALMPTATIIPEAQKFGEIASTGFFRDYGIESHLMIGLPKNFSLYGSYSHLNTDYNTYYLDSFYRHDIIKVGAAYTYNLNSSFRLNLLGGFGGGWIHAAVKKGNVWKQYYGVQLRLNHFFIQPGIQYVEKNFSLGFAMRFSQNQTNFRGDGHQSNWISPVVQLASREELFQFFVQYAWVNPQVYLPYKHRHHYYGMGITVRLQPFKKRNASAKMSE